MLLQLIWLLFLAAVVLHGLVRGQISRAVNDAKGLAQALREGVNMTIESRKLVSQVSS